MADIDVGSDLERITAEIEKLILKQEKGTE